jgi:hypothetical protein
MNTGNISDKSAPFSVSLSTDGMTIGEYREPTGRLHRFTICRVDKSEVFVILKPSLHPFGGMNHIMARQSQVRKMLREDLSEHQVDEMLDFAVEHPLNTSRN